MPGAIPPSRSFTTLSGLVDKYWLGGLTAALASVAVAFAASRWAHFGLAGSLLSTLVFIISLALMHRTAGLLDHTRLSIASFFYIGYLPMIYYPSFIVFGERIDPARWTFLVAVQLVLVAVPLGIGFASHAARYSWAAHDRFYEAPTVIPADTRYQFHAATLLAAIAVLLTVVYFAHLQFDRIPLVYMIAHPNDTDQLQYLREESFKLFDPRWNTASSSQLFYAFLFLRTLFYPFLILFTFGYAICTRETRWTILFVLCLSFGAFYASASIARAPLAAIVMRIMFFYYVFRGGQMGRRATTMLITGMLAFPLLVTALAYGSSSFPDALARLGKRFFYTPADDLYVYFEIFPRHIDYQFGGTLAKPLLKLFELPYFYIENYVYLYQFPNGLPTGHANAAFLSNLHADFGLWGVGLGAFLAGVFMQGIQIYIARQPKSVLSITTFAFMMYAFWVLNFGSITSVLGTNGVFAALLMAWGMRVLTRVLRKAGTAGRAARLAVAGAA